jgi:hypothetical protein
VVWPSGRVQRFGPLPGDTGYLVQEGRGAPVPLPGFRPSPRNQLGQDEAGLMKNGD